ncbi:MAG TPA: AAA family ATPase, partial [Methylomirabilota bacterium]|nr:AAA family ATPase [Methylomirabilota bacterium]
MKLEKIRIRNLRSLADTGFIDLKPLTLLVGVNSSGKSTFLRTFPLLRQSVETVTKGPILWYGRYVDFGGFDTAVMRTASPREVTMDFQVQLRPNADPTEVRSWYYPAIRVLEELPTTVSLSLTSLAEGETKPSKVEIRFADHYIVIEADPEGRIKCFRLNDRDILEGSDFRLAAGENLLPRLVLT